MSEVQQEEEDEGEGEDLDQEGDKSETRQLGGCQARDR